MSTPEFPKEGTGGRPLAKPSTWSIVLVVAVVLAIWMAETPPVQETDRVCVSAATCIRWRSHRSRLATCVCEDIEQSGRERGKES